MVPNTETKVVTYDGIMPLFTNSVSTIANPIAIGASLGFDTAN